MPVGFRVIRASRAAMISIGEMVGGNGQAQHRCEAVNFVRFASLQAKFAASWSRTLPVLPRGAFGAGAQGKRGIDGSQLKANRLPLAR